MRLVCTACVVCFSLSQLVWADNVLEKEAVTPVLFHKIAQSEKVPASLLYSIVLAESQYNQNGKAEPWPWTINHAGKPYFFKSMLDAVIFARELINNNDENFDVGLGQLHWKYHGRNFNSLADAFHPDTNLRQAAKFLRRQFNRPQCKGWKGAIGCYHRPNQQADHHRYRAKEYTKRVMKIWKTLEHRQRNGQRNNNYSMDFTWQQDNYQ